MVLKNILLAEFKYSKLLFFWRLLLNLGQSYPFQDHP